MEYPGLKRDPLRSTGKAPVTQLQYARAGIITKEMEYIAIENLFSLKKKKRICN